MRSAKKNKPPRVKITPTLRIRPCPPGVSVCVPGSAIVVHARHAASRGSICTPLNRQNDKVAMASSTPVDVPSIESRGYVLELKKSSTWKRRRSDHLDSVNVSLPLSTVIPVLCWSITVV